MKRICNLIACSMLSIASVNAIVVQKMYLKNGTQLEGYISMQRPGKSFSFIAERAVVLLPGKDVKSIVDQSVNISQLSDEWIKWAEENAVFEGTGNNRTLRMSNIVTDNATISKVRILEKGAQIKYLEMNNSTYSLNWDTIAIIKADKRDKTMLSGINRVYTMEDGRELEGEYVEEVPGKTLSLYQSNGVVEVVETNKVLKYAVRKFNPNQNLFEQSELLDVILLKNNQVKHKGIIIEQNYGGRNSSDNNLLLQTEDGGTHIIRLEEIDEFRKEINGKYRPIYDVFLKEGEWMINRQSVREQKVVENEESIFIGTDTLKVSVPLKSTPTDVVIETRWPQGTVVATSLKIVSMRKYFLDKKRKNFKYFFTYEDVVKSTVYPKKVETSINGTTKYTYELSNVGLYAIYDAVGKRVRLFEVCKL